MEVSRGVIKRRSSAHWKETAGKTLLDALRVTESVEHCDGTFVRLTLTDGFGGRTCAARFSVNLDLARTGNGLTFTKTAWET